MNNMLKGLLFGFCFYSSISVASDRYLTLGIYGGANDLNAPELDNYENFSKNNNTNIEKILGINNLSSMYGFSLGLTYEIIPYISVGIESGYYYSKDNYNFSNIEISSNNYNFKTEYNYIPLMGKLQLEIPLTPFTAILKGGISYVKQDIKVTGHSNISHTTNKFKPIYAIGFGYSVGIVSLFLEYQEIISSGKSNKYYNDIINGQNPSSVWGSKSFLLALTIDLPM